jgi:hypothetical protein
LGSIAEVERQGKEEKKMKGGGGAALMGLYVSPSLNSMGTACLSVASLHVDLIREAVEGTAVAGS